MAQQLAADGDLDAADVELLERFAIQSEIVPGLDLATYKAIEEAGDLPDDLTPEEEARARHTLRRAAAMGVHDLAAFSGRDPKEMRALLADVVNVPEGDDDMQVLWDLQELARGDRHAELRDPGDDGSEEQARADLEKYLAEIMEMD